MTLVKKRSRSYGTNHTDIQAAIAEHSRVNGYVATNFSNSTCGPCGNDVFRVLLDDSERCAIRICASCKTEHFIADSSEYAEDAELGDCACPCREERFQVAVGVSLYADSEDVMWLYLGLRCVTCGLTAVYGDWKNEFQGYTKLLAMV